MKFLNNLSNRFWGWVAFKIEPYLADPIISVDDIDWSLKTPMDEIDSFTQEYDEPVIKKGYK